jgi:hypothetical protein
MGVLVEPTNPYWIKEVKRLGRGAAALLPIQYINSDVACNPLVGYSIMIASQFNDSNLNVI